jgi:hypothetical protein
VVDGFEEFMVLETLERHSDEGRELLARCRSVGGVRSGDRAFDLATWSYYAPSDAALRATVVERIGEKGMSVYLAHMAIRQADWSIRHHGDEAGWQTVHYGLQLARAFP